MALPARIAREKKMPHCLYDTAWVVDDDQRELSLSHLRAQP